MIKPTEFKMLVDSRLEVKATAGTTVYKCLKYDYGCASEDTRNYGFKHISVTLDPTGDYPFFTVALNEIEEVENAEYR